MIDNKKINKQDLLFGSVYVTDNYDAPEIKKMWEEFDKFHREMAIALQEWERKKYIKYIFKSLITVFVGVSVILCIIFII